MRTINRGAVNITAENLEKLLLLRDDIEISNVEFHHNRNALSIYIVSDEPIKDVTFESTDGARTQETYLENIQKSDKGEVSDGYHTFNELYDHRMTMFSIICSIFPCYAWKSWKHSDGTMYDDYFIVGITTPEGDYSYHYHKDHWDKFDAVEIPNAPVWDGHKPSDIGRLYSLLKEV